MPNPGHEHAGMRTAPVSPSAPAIAADREVLRALAAEVAGIAALPVQEEKRRLWRALNRRAPLRPMVMIDQVCWSELEEADPEALALRCRDPACRDYEQRLRRILYQWRRFPVDMVVEPWIGVRLAVSNSGFGLGVDEERLATDAANDVVSHAYRNQLVRDEDLAKVQAPRIAHDQAESARRLEHAAALFDGLLEVRPWVLDGYTPYLSIWDPVSHWMGAEGTLLALVDRPDFMHALAERMTTGYLGMLDQFEAQGLLTGPQPLIHCTGAWSDELPAGDGPRRCRDLWMFGLAQVLGAASPRMFAEFEIAYTRRICERFGLVYYGCCDPLDRKMAQVRQLPNVRKVSMSPWTDQARGAAAIGRDFVFSRKPNPAHLAMTAWDGELVRRDLAATRAVCAEHGCPLELILKDISTLRHQPQRLSAWADIAMQVAEG